MHVALCVVELELNGIHSLKEKRQILRSITRRVSNQFNVAVAEVDRHDTRQAAVIGLVTVGTDAAVLHSRLEKIVNWIAASRPDVPIADYWIEMR